MKTEPITELFVYGTLMTGRPAHGLLARWVVGRAVARTRGRLWLMPPGYPALVAAETDAWVHGEVLSLRRAPWASLDDYEGHDPEDEAGSLYRRSRRPVEVGDRPRSVWCYWMPEEKEASLAVEGARPLPEGRWPPG